MSDNEAIKSGRTPERKLENLPRLDIDTLNVVGNSYKGPAFVPQHVSSHNTSKEIKNTFENLFGNNTQNKYKNLRDEYNCYVDSQAYEASRNWFANGGQQLSFTRVLGIGSGKKNSDGTYENSGFNVSKPIYSGSIKSGNEYINPNSKPGGVEGSVSFIVKRLTNKSLSIEWLDPFRNYLTEELGIDETTYPSFITDIVMCPSGVLPSIHSIFCNDVTNGKTIEFDNNRIDQPDIQSLISDKLSNQVSNLSFADNTSNSLYGYPLEEISSIDTWFKPSNAYIFLNGFDNKKDENVVNTLKIKKESTITNNRSYNETMSKNYFSKKIIEKGHYFYSSYLVNETMSLKENLKHNISEGVSINLGNIGIVTALKKSVVDTMSGGATIPDYNDFTSSYKTALTPWITSQQIVRYKRSSLLKKTIHNDVEKLFRFFSLTDGESGNKYRIKICPKRVFSKKENKYSIFDIFVFEYNVISNDYNLLESYENLNLNPDSKSYIGRAIGTEHTYYDIETKKITTKGDFPNISEHIRVEVSIEVKEKITKIKSVPSGFMSYPHINFKKEAFNKYKQTGFGVFQLSTDTLFNNFFDNIYQMPIVYNPNHTIDYTISKQDSLAYKNTWGPLFYNVRKVFKNYNKIFVNNFTESLDNIILKRVIYEERSDDLNNKSFSPHYFYTKFLQNNYLDDNKNFVVEENDWLNSFFHLEKIIYPIASHTHPHISWSDSMYIRSGKSLQNVDNIANTYYKYVNIDNLLNKEIDSNFKINSINLSFDVFTYGGFDGTNILDKDKSFFNNNSINREKHRESFSSTRNSYEEAIDISTKYENCLNDIFIIPGISDSNIISKVVDIANENNRFIFISDVRSTTINKEFTGDYFKVINETNTRREETVILDVEVDNSSIPISFSNPYSKNEIINFDLYYKKFSGSNYSSRFFIPLMGEIVNSTSSFVLCPSIYASGLMAKTISMPIEANSMQYKIGNLLVDNENLKYSNENFKSNSLSFKDNSLNIIYEDNSSLDIDTSLKLYSSNTTFEIRDSAYRQSSTTRTVNFIKKRIEYELLLNENSILFQLNSSTNDLYKLTENRLRIVMNRLVDEGVISNFYVSVPKLVISELNSDLINNILRIKIFIQLINAKNKEDKMHEITLGEINKEIKSLTNLSENLQLLYIS
tara:strand:+ start:511 stop:3990 length:3480 start_codon:yes stop_codon:yes gene_type:complete